MGKIVYGYMVLKGEVVTRPDEAEKLLSLYENAAKGMSLSESGKAAGMDTCHTQLSKLLTNPIYLGTMEYPQLVPKELFRIVGELLAERRDYYKRIRNTDVIRLMNETELGDRIWNYTMEKAEMEFEDPKLQAEYVWSLIRRK